MTVSDTTALEAALRRDRLVVVTALAAVIAVAWIWIVLGAGTGKIAIAITRKGGEIVCVGLGASTELYQYARAALESEERVFRGSLMGSRAAERDIPLYLSLYRDGKMPLNRLKSSTMGFEGLNHSLDLLDCGAVVRQILLPNS